MADVPAHRVFGLIFIDMDLAIATLWRRGRNGRAGIAIPVRELLFRVWVGCRHENSEVRWVKLTVDSRGYIPTNSVMGRSSPSFSFSYSQDSIRGVAPSR